MRKYVIIILALFIINLTSCVSDSSPHNINESKNSLTNDSFFSIETVNLIYNAKFQLDSTYEGKSEFQVFDMGKYHNGNLYSIKLENLPIDLHKYDIKDRLDIGWFYVKEDQVFKINPTDGNINKIKSGKVPEDSTLVCNRDDVPDSLQSDEKGWHSYIKVYGNTCEYHAWNNMVESGYYESMIWKKNKGLIYYKSGYGAGYEEIEYVLDEK